MGDTVERRESRIEAFVRILKRRFECLFDAASDETPERQMTDRFPVEQDVAFAGIDQPADQARSRGFAGTAFAPTRPTLSPAFIDMEKSRSPANLDRIAS